MQVPWTHPKITLTLIRRSKQEKLSNYQDRSHRFRSFFRTILGDTSTRWVCHSIHLSCYSLFSQINLNRLGIRMKTIELTNLPCLHLGVWQKFPTYPSSHWHSKGLKQNPCSEQPGNVSHALQLGPVQPGKQLGTIIEHQQ